MSRLITFGCSYTFGTGLPDCKAGATESSKLGWPSILSNKLNLELVNISSAGASNFEILNNIINFNFKESDTVAIMWTHYVRDLFFKKWPEADQIVRLGPWTTGDGTWLSKIIDTQVIVGKKWRRSWIENMNDKTFALKSWSYIHHADLYLQSKKIKYIHCPAFPGELNKYPVSYTINNFYSNGFLTIDYGSDNAHPGIKSNEKTAEILYTILNEQYTK